jgi:sugar/nucleoside kinase (ribokinase family)
LYECLKINNIVIRKNRRAYAYSPQGFTAIDTLFVEKPKLLTGAGDNFNAGMMAALILDADWKQALTFGTMVSSHYILNAESPVPESFKGD